jgi:hypothetical protein
MLMGTDNRLFWIIITALTVFLSSFFLWYCLKDKISSSAKKAIANTGGGTAVAAGGGTTSSSS